MKTAILHNGVTIPLVGLGTWKSKDEDAYNAVLCAIKEGYTHIDTAAIYGNEEAVGRAIKDSGVDRETLFVTTKVWNTKQGYQSTIDACEDSLQKLELEYVDLYLIHWFKGYENSLETYRAMEYLYEQGKVKAIGVSNYNVHHIQHLLNHAKIPPMVNQVETHVTLQNEFLRSFCEEHNIQLEAYAPLMSSQINELLEMEILQKIAKKHQKSVPQIAIRWLIERQIVVIPKSITPSRIKSNFDVFDFTLDQEDLEQIKTLNRGNKMFPEMDNVTF